MAVKIKNRTISVNANGAEEHWRSEYPGSSIELHVNAKGQISYVLKTVAASLEEAIREATDADAKLQQWIKVRMKELMSDG